MAAKLRTQVPVLVAVAGLFVTPFCCLAEERTPSADDAVRVTAKKDGQTITVDAVFKVAATQRQAWDVLTDFDHMPNFVPNLESSKVVSRSGNVLQVAQKGRETYGLLSFSFDNLREVELAPYTQIKSHLISGSMQKSDGTTHLSENGGTTQVTYHGVFIPNVNVPGLLGIPAIESATRRQFEELRHEIERRPK
jgi:carbon monoxide dehydrogenase subunit G